jgi:hypothetical protein
VYQRAYVPNNVHSEDVTMKRLFAIVSNILFISSVCVFYSDTICPREDICRGSEYDILRYKLFSPTVDDALTRHIEL